MKYIQAFKEKNQAAARKLDTKLRKDKVVKAKKIILWAFVSLIVLDIIFVLPGVPFPTISRVVLNSSPKFFFIIWLWGLITANFLFPRRKHASVFPRIQGLLIIMIVAFGLFLFGNSIEKKSAKLSCPDSTSVSIPFYTNLQCFNSCDERIDCVKASTQCDHVKLDLKVEVKLFFIIIGMILGYYLWPQIEREES